MTFLKVNNEVPSNLSNNRLAYIILLAYIINIIDIIKKTHLHYMQEFSISHIKPTTDRNTFFLGIECLVSRLEADLLWQVLIAYSKSIFRYAFFVSMTRFWGLPKNGSPITSRAYEISTFVVIYFTAMISRAYLAWKCLKNQNVSCVSRLRYSIVSWFGFKNKKKYLNKKSCLCKNWTW